ncbi:hypothetical protein PG984_011514 [Apiospora sp. TS-2023a]
MSIASQVSNSKLNDVQQSSKFILGLHKEALGELTTLEKRISSPFSMVLNSVDYYRLVMNKGVVNPELENRSKNSVGEDHHIDAVSLNSPEHKTSTEGLTTVDNDGATSQKLLHSLLGKISKALIPKRPHSTTNISFLVSTNETECNAAKTLRMSITQIDSIIKKVQLEMPTLGFNNGQRFDKEVRNPLADLRRGVERSVKINARRRQRNKWLDEDFPHLTSIATEIAEDIEQCLQRAICTRDAYLVAAYEVMDEVARESAAQAGIDINDRHDNQLLIERSFESRNVELDVAFNNMRQQYNLPH